MTARILFIPPTSHTLGEVVRLGLHTQARASQSPPQAGRVTMVLNPHDPVVNNQVARKVGKQWPQHGYDHLEIYELNRALRLPHDIIDLSTRKQRSALIHSILVRLITYKLVRF